MTQQCHLGVHTDGKIRQRDSSNQNPAEGARELDSSSARELTPSPRSSATKATQALGGTNTHNDTDVTGPGTAAVLTHAAARLGLQTLRCTEEVSRETQAMSHAVHSTAQRRDTGWQWPAQAGGEQGFCSTGTEPQPGERDRWWQRSHNNENHRTHPTTLQMVHSVTYIRRCPQFEKY